MNYLIPIEYDPATKIIRLLKVTANEGTATKPSKYIIEGIYNGSEGSDLKRANNQNATQELLRFYIKPIKPGYKLYIFWHTGSDIDLLPVAELPSPASKKGSPLKASVVSNISIPQYNWLIGKWIGVIKMEKETRTLEIAAVNEGVKATYGVTGKGMSPLGLNVSGDNVFFETGAKSKVSLNKVSDSQMEGTFETSNGRITEVKFSKY